MGTPCEIGYGVGGQMQGGRQPTHTCAEGLLCLCVHVWCGRGLQPHCRLPARGHIPLHCACCAALRCARSVMLRSAQRAHRVDGGKVLAGVAEDGSHGATRHLQHPPGDNNGNN